MANIPLVSCISLSKGFGVTPLFEDLSITIGQTERIGLIGPNGSGKSTMLRIMAGQDEADTGEIAQRRGLHLVYLPQEDHFEEGATVGSTLDSAFPADLTIPEKQQKLDALVGTIELPSLSQLVAELSGGWRKRLALMQALLREPELLLMDEPTNHLDMEGILWLEQQLAKEGISYVMVSHDRGMLETSCNRMVELNRCYREGYLSIKGGFNAFIELRDAYLRQQNIEEQRLSNVVRREVEWLRRGPAARTTKSRSRIDKAEKLQSDLQGVKERNRSLVAAGIDFDATGRRTRLLVQAKDLALSRGGKILFENLELRLGGGNCLGILGPNGSGKSSLLQLMCSALEPDEGSIKLADGLKIVLFDQKREQLDLSLTLRQALAEHGDQVEYKGKPVHVAAWAKRFLFKPEQLNQPLHSLSGGEQARVLIANLMRKPADLLMLDEPTNDLDLMTLQILEDNLSDFAGALVLISHDRCFMDRMCDQLLSLEEGGAVYYSDLSQWHAAWARRQKQRRPPNDETAPAAIPKAKKKAGLTHEERKELKKIEGKLEKAEALVVELEGKLHDPAIVSDPTELLRLTGEMDAAQMVVDGVYARWEELEEKG